MTTGGSNAPLVGRRLQCCQFGKGCTCNSPTLIKMRRRMALRRERRTNWKETA